MRGRLIDGLTKLFFVGDWRKKIRSQRDRTRDQQNHQRNSAHATHRRSPVRTGAIKSENELAVTVTSAMISVRLTSSGTSRPRAARQASCPMPGVSVTTSTGIA